MKPQDCADFFSFTANQALQDAEAAQSLEVQLKQVQKVKVQSIHPTPTERTKLELLIWQFSLPTGGEQKIDYRFVVEHPQDIRVMGLP